MKYLLDTNIVSYAIRGEGRVAEYILAHRPSQLGVSSITVAEIRYGIYKRDSKRLARLVDSFLAPIQELAFDSEAADYYGRIAAELAAAGSPIGHFDTLIAAHAMALGRTLVTRNLKHFGQVEGLSIEDWY